MRLPTSLSTKQPQYSFPPSSFATRLVVLFMLISLPVGAYFVFITFTSYNFSNDEARTRVHTYTDLFADHYESHLQLTHDFLNSINAVTSSDITTGCAMLPDLLGDMYRSLSVYDNNGDIICTTPTDSNIAVPPVWLALSDTTDALDATFLVDNERLIAGHITSDLIVIAPINLDWVGDWLTTIALPMTVTVSIVNSDQAVIAYYSAGDTGQTPVNTTFFDAELFADLENTPDGVARADAPDGIASYFGRGALSDDLAIILSIPEEELTPIYGDLLVASIVGLGVMVIVYVFIAWRLSLSLIINPVKAIIDRTATLSMGDTHTRINIRPIRIAELNLLAEKINQLATSLQKRDEEVCEYTRRLQQEIADHKRTIGQLQAEMQARKQAEASGNNRLKFMGIVAHELKTPLTTIKGFARTLLATDVSWDEANSREFISVIDEEADLLADMIEQLLDISQIDAGRLSTHMVLTDLSNIFRTAETRIQTLTKHHKLVLNMQDKSPVLKADPIRISQVLVNLIGNAAKYSPPETTITVDVHEIAGKWVQIDVRDEGQGIPQDQRDMLFKPFHRIDEQTRGIKGTGLGLSICKGIIDVHQGDIWITDHGDLPGTTFSFTLPIVPKADNITAN